MNFALRSFRSLSRRIAVGARERFRRAWQAAYQPWRRFWFEPADPTPLGVMRILFGGLLLYTHIVWGLNLEGFFGPDGWQGTTLVRTLQAGQFAWSFWWWIPVGHYVAVHLLCLAVLAMFMLGAFTPVTSVLAYLITVSYSTRAPMANYGLDQINGLAALYLAIGPSGRALSVDRWRERFRAAREQLAQGREPTLPTVQPSARANLALRLIEVHLCVIYVFACLSKLLGESWWNGAAIWQVVSNLEYQSRDLTWLAWYPWLVNLLTHATIAWEMTFWALVWRPLMRPFVLLMGTAIHLGIGAFMGMWTFGLAMIFAYVAFLPGERMAPLLRRGARRAGRALRSLGLAPGSSAGTLLRAAWFALGLDDKESKPPETQDASPLEEPAAPPLLQPVAPARRLSTISPAAQSRPAADALKLLPTRPAILLVEGRLKRQTEVQEYFLNHGFRCHVASEVHQARSMLAVIEIDALIVTASWLSEDELAAFHEGLVGGGAALPASVFLLAPTHKQASGRFQETARHRVLFDSVSLRELRHLILEVLRLTEESLRPLEKRHSHSKNGQRETTRLDSASPPAAMPQTDANSPSASGGNGSLP